MVTFHILLEKMGSVWFGTCREFMPVSAESESEERCVELIVEKIKMELEECREMNYIPNSIESKIVTVEL